MRSATSICCGFAPFLLLAPIPIIARLHGLRAAELGNAGLSAQASSDSRLSVNPFSGFKLLVSDRYLTWIGIFILLYVTINTFLYFEIRNPLGDLSQVRRAQIWANIDLWVNSLAAVTALFGTGRLATRLGLPKTLGLIPGMMIIAWLIGRRISAGHKSFCGAGDSPRGQLRNHPTGSGNAIYIGQQRSAIQSETRD